MDVVKNIKESVSYIQGQWSDHPKVGLTLGSGLSSFADQIDVQVKIPYDEIPHFNPPTVEGHSGHLVLGHIKGISVAILQGRVHFYEGHAINQVTHATRVLAQLGVETLILTNAAGSLVSDLGPGSFMVITDHINLTGQNPLIGPNIDEFGPRFPDMSEPYKKDLSNRLIEILRQHNINFSTGTYVGVTGPTYETASEINMYSKLGGKAVGMSTVFESIVANHMGVKVCGMSCITNFGTGIVDQKITHDEVKEIAAKVEKDFSRVLIEFIESIGQ